MVTRTVISRAQRAETSEEKHFKFTVEMIPGINNPLQSPLIQDYRRHAWEIYQNLTIPSTVDEAWRRTDLTHLKPGRFQLAEFADKTALNHLPVPDELLMPLVDNQNGGQIVISPSGLEHTLDSDLQNKGVVFTDLINAEIEFSELLSEVRGKIVRPEEGKFSALPAALARQGLFLYIPKGVHVEKPLHSVMWNPGIDLAYLSHLVIWLDDNASLTYVHESASLTEIGGNSLHAGIVEIMVGKNANLRFVELQSWGNHVWNFTHERVRVEQDGEVDWIFGAIGSRVTKNFSDLDLVGEGAIGRMSGFYFTDGNQHLDHDTQQNHLAPHTTSDLLFKGALRDESRSVWQGMIYVAPGAQKADGYQANRNLVLSKKARADSIPGLEILADDVRCTHGATVGKIDPDLLFYLRSRGITIPEAERLVVEGFFDPIMQRIPFEGVRTRFQNAIIKKMK